MKTDWVNERDQIADYLAHVASVEIGSMIDSFTAREVLEFASHWIRNELDTKWAQEMRKNGGRR
jgi:hypothetical protein